VQMIAVRGSEYQDFLRCRKRWHWRWVEGLKSKKPNNKLLFGNMIHKYLEVYNNTKDTVDAYKAMKFLYLEADTQYADQVEIQELFDLANTVTDNYVTNYQDQDRKLKTIATELEFIIHLDDDIFYTGTIDWVFEDEEGRLWFSDHKTTDSIEKYAKNSVMDRQISRYWWALQQLTKGVGKVKHGDEWLHPPFELMDKEVYGFVYNIIVRDAPHAPKVLKSGQLSKDKSQRTTHDLYLKALMDIHDDETFYVKDEYQDIVSHLKEQENRYFRRIDVTRLQPEIDASILEFFTVSQDIAVLSEMGDSPMLYRNITSDCSWDCEFRGLCELQITGGNTQLLLDLNYEKGVR
jgi:hypothetical protein